MAWATIYFIQPGQLRSRPNGGCLRPHEPPPTVHKNFLPAVLVSPTKIFTDAAALSTVSRRYPVFRIVTRRLQAIDLF